MTKKSKFTNFLNNIISYKEKTTVLVFKGGTSITTSSEPVFNLDWSIPKWKTSKIEFEKFKFKFELKILEKIFKNTQYLSPLSIDVWSKLQNTTSYKITSLEKVEKITKKNNEDLNGILNAIENKEYIEAPIIIKWDENEYELVCGNIHLMIASALGTIPNVMILEII